MRTAACTVVAALLALLNAPKAHAETSNRPSSRFHAGIGFGSLGGPSYLSIDHGRWLDEHGSINITFNADYVHGLLPYFGLGLFAGVGTGGASWSLDRGESRSRAQFALGPVFIAPFPGAPGTELRIGLPVGYTYAWFNPAKGRAVKETFSNGHGMNAALVVGVDITGKHHGAFVDLAYALNLTWLTHTATLKSDPSVRSQQEHRYFEHGLMLGAGYVYRF